MEEENRKLAARKIIGMSQEQVSKVLIFMAGMEAERMIREQNEKEQFWGFRWSDLKIMGVVQVTDMVLKIQLRLTGSITTSAGNDKCAAIKTTDYAIRDILGTDSIFWIGKANWQMISDGEFYQGYLDDICSERFLE